MAEKNIPLDFSDMSGGKNSAFPRHAVGANQCVDTLNAMHEMIGISRAPGYQGLTTTPIVAAPSTGFFRYIQDDGTETGIVVSNGKVYALNLTTKELDEIGAMTGTGECYAVNASGKLWICNGTEFIKIEDDLSVYRVQIVAPAAGTAAALAGGTLADGIYGVYACYARKDTTTGQYLYSLPKSLGNITLGTGNNSVRVAAVASTDPQVNKIVVFMTDAGGTVHYFYKEAANTTANIDVTSSADRLAGVKMAIVSAQNQILPKMPNAIYEFDDKLFVWVIGDKNVYWSLKTDVNPFDMERFLPENFRTIARPINAMFSVGSDLWFNHIGLGMSVAYSGDMASVIKFPQRQYWYLDCKTEEGKTNICPVKSTVFGLTNDGFRFFDGSTFSDDVSFHIKPDIDRVYANASVLPCAIVNRRVGKRAEYRFFFENYDYGSSGNNDQLVFNLDYFFDPNGSRRTWERWENGVAYAIHINGAFYGLQNSTAAAQIITEVGVSDLYCYSRTGAYLSVKFLKQLYILSRTYITQINAIGIWGTTYTFATSAGKISGSLIIFDNQNTKFGFEIQGVAATQAVLPSESSGLGLELPFIMNPQFPIVEASKQPFTCRGKSVAIEISQVEDDNELFIYKIQLPDAVMTQHNLT